MLDRSRIILYIYNVFNIYSYESVTIKQKSSDHKLTC